MQGYNSQELPTPSPWDAAPWGESQRSSFPVPVLERPSRTILSPPPEEWFAWLFALKGAPMPLFNRHAAARYATRYALASNPAYPEFPNDCTSFVSQSLLEGGWTMTEGSVWNRTDDNVWWWGKSSFTRASYTWGGAHNFSRYVTLSGRGRSCPREDLDYGDVVQIARNNHVFHTMIVTSLTASAAGNGPHMSYHTTHTLNKFLGTIEASYPSSSGYSFLYWKILDVF